MADVTGTYTPPQGLTPAGTQLAQGVPNQANSQAPAQAPMPADPNSMSDAQLSGAIGSVTGQIAGMDTPTYRQNYLNNSNLVPMQQNFDQMAQQLYQYDKSVIAPNYTSPSIPNDATSFGSGPLGVAASPLALTASILGSPNFNFVNPELGIQSQTAQKSNIADLLDTLQQSIAKEGASREGTYASQVGSLRDILSPLLQNENTRTQAQATLQAARIAAGAQIQSALIQLGILPPGAGGSGGGGGGLNDVLNTLPGGTGGGATPTPASTGTQAGVTARQAYQQAYNNAPVLGPIRKAIEDRWNQQFGSEGSLFPSGPANDQESTDLTNSLNALGAISKIQDTLGKSKGQTFGSTGLGAGALSMIGGPGAALLQLINPNAANVLQSLQTLEQNKLINNSSSYLDKSPDQLQSSLGGVQKKIIQNLMDYATQHGFDSFTQIPQFQQNQGLYGAMMIPMTEADGSNPHLVPISQVGKILQQGGKLG